MIIRLSGGRFFLLFDVVTDPAVVNDDTVESSSTLEHILLLPGGADSSSSNFRLEGIHFLLLLRVVLLSLSSTTPARFQELSLFASFLASA